MTTYSLAELIKFFAKSPHYTTRVNEIEFGATTRGILERAGINFMGQLAVPSISNSLFGKSRTVLPRRSANEIADTLSYFKFAPFPFSSFKIPLSEFETALAEAEKIRLTANIGLDEHYNLPDLHASAVSELVGEVGFTPKSRDYPSPRKLLIEQRVARALRGRRAPFV